MNILSIVKPTQFCFDFASEIRLLEKVIDAALHKTRKLETRQDDEGSGDDDVIDTGGEGEGKNINLFTLGAYYCINISCW